MAEPSYLFLLPLEEVEDDVADPAAAGDLHGSSAGALDQAAAGGDPDPFLPVYPPSDPSDSDSDYDGGNPLALDLFDRRRGDRIIPRGASSMDLFPDGPHEMGLDYLGLELGLRLGLGSSLDTDRDDGGGGGGGCDGDRDHHRDMVSDWGADEFFVGRRSSPSESIEFSRARPLDSEGLRIVQFDSDSDSDEQIVAMGEEQIVAVGVNPDGGGEEEGRDATMSRRQGRGEGRWQRAAEDGIGATMSRRQGRREGRRQRAAEDGIGATMTWASPLLGLPPIGRKSEGPERGIRVGGGRRQGRGEGRRQRAAKDGGEAGGEVVVERGREGKGG